MLANAAQQYQDSVQRFLRALLVPFFLGAGQSTQRTKFIALRWRNLTKTTWDLFIHDSQMIFILSYHKGRHQSNASRWPARYLLPEVAQLVTQYLTIIQPFQHFLQDQAQIPSDSVGDYLWADSAAPWTEDMLTQALVQQGRRLLGKHIHLQAWH
jgi:hypothetical protein